MAKQETQAFTRNQLISSLLKIRHAPKNLAPGEKRDNISKLKMYLDDALAAAKSDATLFGHIIAWNSAHGEVEDGKLAYPVVALRGLSTQDKELAENAVAHLLTLNPKELMRAWQFSHYLTFSRVVTSVGMRDFTNKDVEVATKADSTIKIHSYPLGIPSGHRKLFQEGIAQYLEARESHTKWWDKAALQYRSHMKYLYKVSRIRPSAYAHKILFDREFAKNSIFQKVADLSNAPAKEAAGIILEHKLPFEVIVGAYPSIKKEHAVILALMEGMSGNQIITSTNMLKRLGVFEDEVLKSAYEAAVARAKGSKKTTRVLKAGKAAEQQDADSTAGRALKDLQDAGLKRMRGMEGDWAVFGDRSHSMRTAIDMSRHISGFLAQGVRGAVYLLFFNESPTFMEVTGLAYDQILEKTKGIVSNGGTSIGSAMDYLLARKILVNGIVIVSDGGEWNAPMFADTYKTYCRVMDIEPTVYLIHIPGADPDNLSRNCQQQGVRIEKIEMETADYNVLPNVLSVLKANRYQLFDDIMETPLLTFADVFKEGAKAATA